MSLARRLRGVSGDIELERPLREPLAVGQRRTFQVIRLPGPGLGRKVPPGLETIDATLRLVTEHGYIYVQDGQPVEDGDIVAAGEALEEVLPTVLRFGALPQPGVDGDSHVAVVYAELPNLGGYVNDADFYPMAVAPASNEAEGVYIDIGLLRSRAVNPSVLAHELQHLVHFGVDPNEEVWVQEGLSQVAGVLVSEVSTGFLQFAAAPDTQLNVWDPTGESFANYGGAELFFRYLLHRTGDDPAILEELVAEPADGIEGVEAVLRRHVPGVTFEDFFADFVTANLANAEKGPYGYDDITVSPRLAATLTGPVEDAGSVHQFAADYIEVELPQGNAVFSFEGESTVSALGNEAHSGRGQWWSGRGDAIDSTLTRTLDLRGLTSATLTFWTWFDIENWYDYGFVEVSTDSGRTWQALPGLHTTDEDPLHQAYGPGYTGISGGAEAPDWVEEHIDLTPFAGRVVLLRFEYVTDGGVSTRGWALDDIAVPELNLLDDAEASGDWQAEGFQRIEEPLRQRFVLRLIEFGPDLRVTDIPLDDQNRAQVRLTGFGAGLERAVIVVAAATRGTSEVAPYRYSLLRPAP